MVVVEVTRIEQEWYKIKAMSQDFKEDGRHGRALSKGQLAGPTWRKSCWPSSASFSRQSMALFRPGINMGLGWSSHKWTALSTGVNAPKTHWGCTKIQLLRPHSEVVWATYGHILSAVYMCPGPHWSTTYSSDFLLISGIYATQQCYIKVRQ